MLIQLGHGRPKRSIGEFHETSVQTLHGPALWNGASTKHGHREFTPQPEARLTETYTVVLGWVSPASVALVVFPWPLDKFQKDGRKVEAANMTTFCRMLQNVQVDVWP